MVMIVLVKVAIFFPFLMKANLVFSAKFDKLSDISSISFNFFSSDSSSS